MDSETSTRHYVDLLERVVLDRNAEPTAVPLSLLQHMTNSFSEDRQIGSGGFAVVYKGVVGKGLVAVKKLSRTYDMPESKFHKEVECLMKVKHKNIVRFLGYCSETHGRIADYEGKFVMADLRNWLLCFEYVPNGSLDNYIIDASRGLEWRERFEIIKGICEGLLHLHEKRILHLDLKPGNILIGDRMIPKIADFGLSRCLDKEQTRVFTSNICGSLGYFAPEFFRGQVAFASDIYSLGVIIIEILTGEKGYPEDEDVVGTWTDRLEGSDQWKTQLEQIRLCIKIGIECMDLDPKKRPVARHINDRLDIMASTVEMGTSSSSVEQQTSCPQEKTARLSSEYLGKDIKELVETEELVESDGTPREDYWQQGREEVPGDQWPLWGVQDTKQIDIPHGARSSRPKSGFLYKLKNLDIFNTKTHRNDVLYSGSIFENAKLKLFRKGELKPFLKDKDLIGKGAFINVYKGLVGGVQVVIKKPISGHVLQISCHVLERTQFANELVIQSEVIHRNIVRLLGCCLEVDPPMLVYEFVSRGSLDDILHSNKMRLNLDLRLSIACESSHGLAYMHSMRCCKILHGNLKPSNILLDDNFVTKISDFRISRMISMDSEHTALVIGDRSYMDPVYLRTGWLTEKSDVYSFGVIILELLTRKKATHSDNNSLVRTFLENHMMGRKSTELFDKEIAVTRDLELLDSLAGIAVECLNIDTDLRPTMVDVANRLSILNQSRGQAAS